MWFRRNYEIYFTVRLRFKMIKFIQNIRLVYPENVIYLAERFHI